MPLYGTLSKELSEQVMIIPRKLGWKTYFAFESIGDNPNREV